jgi:hypothetical protein
MTETMTLSQCADAMEEKMVRELDHFVVKSRLHMYADGNMGYPPAAGTMLKAHPGATLMMGDDLRLPAMPEPPTLLDFFKYRFGSSMHLLQSLHRAMKNGFPEKMGRRR